MIETKALLQLMVRDMETIKDDIIYGFMEASKTQEKQLNIFRPILLHNGVKMHKAALISQALA